MENLALSLGSSGVCLYQDAELPLYPEETVWPPRSSNIRWSQALPGDQRAWLGPDGVLGDGPWKELEAG